MRKWVLLLAVFVVGCIALYHASNWWERAFAKYGFSETSPDGCLITKTYQPFWILPAFMHRIPDPDPTFTNEWGLGWDWPTFMRVYEVSTGRLLGESVVYEPSGDTVMIWGDPTSTGRRIVKVNGFVAADTSICADELTLRKLEAAYERKRQGRWAMPGVL